MVYSRIIIVGTSGAGKSTLSRQLSEKLSIPAVELDAIHWLPNWVELSNPEMREQVDKALSPTDSWIADGNYLRSCRDLIWGRADTLIWLEYPLYISLWRALKRTVSRIITGEELWNGNRESLWHHLSGSLRENLFVWAVKMYRQHRREFPTLFEQPECKHLTILRFKNPKETEDWLRGFDGADGADNGGMEGTKLKST
jgi:adenylate kinase family enzyme